MCLLYGGVFVVLVEIVGSIVLVLCLEDLSMYVVVGVELNINYLSLVKEG